MWILLGDFNAVRLPEERKNSQFNHLSALDFNTFIDDVSLQEYYMRGNKFTFLAGKDKDFKLSKIDRVLVCQEFFNRWPLACLRALPGDYFDHCPLLLTVMDSNYGAKPFRWFNSWLEREGCVEVVMKAFDNCTFEGPPDVVINKKLSCIRGVLRSWWEQVLIKEGEILIHLKNDIERIEKVMEERELEEEEIWVWEECKKAMEKLRIAGTQVDWFFKGKLGNGHHLRFWKDRWFGTKALMYRWPNLYARETDKNCKICDRIVMSGSEVSLSGGWNASSSTVEEISELQDVFYMLSLVKYTGNNDSWLWDDEGKAPFSVALVKNLFRKDRDEYRSHKMKWESWVPLKVNILMWRIEMNRIPTRLALHHSHIFLTDITCPLCEVVNESSCHVLADCGFSFGVWSSIWKWCKLDPIYVFDIDDLLHIHKNIKGPKWAKKVIRGIIMTTCWAIWNARNKKVFDEYNPKVAEVVAVVKSMSFLWLKSRSRFISLLWKDWVVFPLYLM
ncbi:RNA-directed DNA polymerase, eukaryota, Reverse transcriptase zinc-binding domain protein [Artemisia annua]|uniref:RNA-directed DNA polymerase, eukaryota, Reverse transcriptase zinc-binding domain protein n=1 Tax=Artemisia annua TaxID=35608 RepID=A0A2U1MDW9_ARTAN|nr:RNA-directed DNA polymerase, eukaryota, Reverse transcriptase zinc-binding domain protein [Artemisia annua]